MTATLSTEKVPHIVSKYFKGEPFVIEEVYVRHEDRETGSWMKPLFYSGKTLNADMLVVMRHDHVRNVSFRLASDWLRKGPIADFRIEELEAGWHARSGEKAEA